MYDKIAQVDFKTKKGFGKWKINTKSVGNRNNTATGQLNVIQYTGS